MKTEAPHMPQLKHYAKVFKRATQLLKESEKLPLADASIGVAKDEMLKKWLDTYLSAHPNLSEAEIENHRELSYYIRELLPCVHRYHKSLTKVNIPKS